MSNATRRPRVYLAGPISRGDLAQNITQATAAFVALARAGFAPWCPQWSAFSGGMQREWVAAADGLPIYLPVAVPTPSGCGLDHAEWLAVDLEWVAAADAVVRLPGESAGADRETAHARDLGIPVFGSVAMLVDGWADGRRLQGKGA